MKKHTAHVQKTIYSKFIDVYNFIKEIYNINRQKK